MAGQDRVGFIGLGTMGAHGRHSRRAACRSWCSTPAPAPRRRRAHAGVTVAGSPAYVARQVTVLFTCLPERRHVRDAYPGRAGVRPARRRPRHV